MSNITNLLSTSESDLKYFKAAGRVADQLNYNAYVIGGYVRDTLLNKNPSKDIDITVNKDYKHYAECLAKELKIKDVVFFEQFKTAKLLNDDTEFEIRSPYANLKAKVVPLPFYDPKKRIPIK